MPVTATKISTDIDAIRKSNLFQSGQMRIAKVV